MNLFFLLSFTVYSTLVLSTPLSSTTKVSAGWYAGWHASEGFPLSKVSWKKYTHMTYAFAETTPDVHNLDILTPTTLSQFVSEARKHGVKTLVSIGGASGSVHFSELVSTPTRRNAFVKTITDIVRRYNLDGVDFDWEFPNSAGDNQNAHSPSDTPNFLSFLQELRQHPVGKNLILTAATNVAPFNGPDGSPVSNVAGFARILDWITIMNYDVWGSWNDEVGPNAPLDDACASPARQQGSATSAVKKWTAAGFPRKQIVLGVPGYGHSFKVDKAHALEPGSSTKLASYPLFKQSPQPDGYSWGGSDGTFNMWGLVESGYLNNDGSVKSDILYRYDSCSQTPYLYDLQKEIMISFDNTKSFAAKGAFIKDSSLSGWAMWEVGSDHKDMLVDSIQKAIGN